MFRWGEKGAWLALGRVGHGTDSTQVATPWRGERAFSTGGQVKPCVLKADPIFEFCVLEDHFVLNLQFVS